MLFLQETLAIAIEFAILLFEWVGVLVLVGAGAMGVINYIRHDSETAIKLGHGFSMALGFLMAGEILHTVIAREWKEIAVLGVIVGLRVVLTVLIHWEIKHERSEREFHSGQNRK